MTDYSEIPSRAARTRSFLLGVVLASVGLVVIPLVRFLNQEADFMADLGFLAATSAVMVALVGVSMLIVGRLIETNAANSGSYVVATWVAVSGFARYVSDRGLPMRPDGLPKRRWGALMATSRGVRLGGYTTSDGYGWLWSDLRGITAGPVVDSSGRVSPGLIFRVSGNDGEEDVVPLAATASAYPFREASKKSIAELAKTLEQLRVQSASTPAGGSEAA